MQTLIIDPPKPHGRKQALIMQALLHPGLEEVWIANGTKWGKTISASTAIVAAALNKPRSIFRWVAPIYNQSKIGWSYCRKILPPPPHISVNLADLEIRVPHLESVIQFYHAQNPVSLEGYGIAGYVFDEAAKIKEDAYASAKTTVTITRGPMIFISTPNGKNWFYQRCMAAYEEMERARYEKRLPKSIFITAPTSDNPHVPKAAIESAKRNLSQRLFRQFFEASFEDEGSVFTNYRENIYTSELDLYGDNQIWFADAAGEKTVVVGADWAKTVDYTAFVAIDLETRKVVGVQRFHKQAYTEAIRRLVYFAKKFKSVEVVYHDKTGVGQAIDDQLAFTDLNFRGITFTNALKAEMVNRLITAFEQSMIQIPHWNQLLIELESFEVQASEIGTLRYGAFGTGHDDIVCALLLAHHALLEYADRNHDLRFLEDFDVLKRSAMEEYYQGLADDE